MLASQSDLCSNFANCPVCQERIARMAAEGPGQHTADARMPRSRRVRFQDAKEEIVDGDVLLWRPTSLLGRGIAWGTGSIRSHASMAGWWYDTLENVEMLQFAGGRVADLQHEVTRWPGSCDVYRPLPPYNGFGALQQMKRLISQDYGWLDFLYIVLHRYLRLPTIPLRNSDDPEEPRVCSAADAWAVRTGGGKLVDERACDAEIVPGDLADEEFSRYVLTLVP
jgi:hypothetical protein